MAKRDEGKKYLDELVKLIPEDKRASVVEALSAEQIQDHLGEHVMMRGDYSKKLDEVRTTAQAVNEYNAELTSWYKQEQARLARAAALEEEVAALKAGKGAPAAQPQDDDADPATTASLKKMTEGMLRKDEAQKLLNDSLAQQGNNLVGLSVSLARLTGQHLKNFDEALDPQAVIDYAMKNKLPSVDAAYNVMFKERYEARAEEAKKKEHEKLEKDIRQKVEDEFRAKNPQAPYIVTTEASLSPILEAMKSKEKPEYGTTAALDEYYRMQRPAGS